jgi:hypothetical protein
VVEAAHPGRFKVTGDGIERQPLVFTVARRYECRVLLSRRFYRSNRKQMEGTESKSHGIMRLNGLFEDDKNKP